MIQISPRLAGRPAPAAPPSPISSSSGDSATSDTDDMNSSSSSNGSGGDVRESLKEMMQSLKEKMNSIEAASKQIDGQVQTLCNKAKEEDTAASTLMDWTKEHLEPLSDDVLDWIVLQGLSATPTLDEFMKAVFAAAESLDLATRTVTMSAEDAAILWGGQRQITVFEIIGLLPTLFRGSAE
jgi:hypothetical protein